jgi:rare lipoprotein A
MRYLVCAVFIVNLAFAASDAEECTTQIKPVEQVISGLIKRNCKQSGVASWYGPGFHGKKTANGETFNQNAMTAAHKTLQFGTKVTVVNKANDRRVTVKINDRGPYAHGRIIDLSKKAAQKLGISGTGNVCLKY